MPSDGARLLAGYRKMDSLLVAAGRHPTSPAFMETLERFWLSGKRRLVIRKGRQGGGSTTMARIAVATGLFGEHRISKGSRLAIPFVSVKKDEARERLYNIEDTLGVLDEPFTRRDDVIELTDRPIIFAVYPCSMRWTVGGTYAAVIEDEVSRWWSDEANANPAVEVDAALMPGGATQPNFRAYTNSSPVGTEDFHAQLMARGETADQCVASGPSWVWNPTITEAATHSLQPDDRRWRREFAAEPQAGALSALDSDQVIAAIGREPPPSFTPCSRVLLLDPTAGSSDTYAFGIAAWHIPSAASRYVTERRWSRMLQRWVWQPIEGDDGKPIANPNWSPERATPRLVFAHIAGIDQAAKRGYSSDAIVALVIQTARKHGAVAIHSDQFERFALASAIGKHGIAFRPHTWTAPLKERAVERVRQWLRDGVLCLPRHDKLKSELLAFEERIAPSGALTFRGRQGGHDDFAMLVMLAALVDIEGGLPGSPIAMNTRYALQATVA